MQETLLTALQAIIVAAVPVLTGFIVKWINAKAAQVATAITNEKATEYIRQVEAAVTTAVAYVSQTYVDEMKKSGSFSRENQETAIRNAIAKASEVLSGEVKSYLADLYGGYGYYLEAKIEQEVRVQKESA